MAQAPRDHRGVALDLHAPSAAVTELAARELVVEVLGAKLEPGGQPLDDACEAGAVRLAGGYETERHAPSLCARFSRAQPVRSTETCAREAW